MQRGQVIIEGGASWDNKKGIGSGGILAVIVSIRYVPTLALMV